MNQVRGVAAGAVVCILLIVLAVWLGVRDQEKCQKAGTKYARSTSGQMGCVDKNGKLVKVP